MGLLQHMLVEHCSKTTAAVATQHPEILREKLQCPPEKKIYLEETTISKQNHTEHREVTVI